MSAVNHLSLDPLGGATPIGKAARVTGAISYLWRGPVTEDEMVDLIRSHGDKAVAGWGDQIRPHSLGWVSARSAGGLLVGFVNVAWDGADHAFLIDTRPAAVTNAKASAPRWYAEQPSTPRPRDASGFTSTFAAGPCPLLLRRQRLPPSEVGLIHLLSLT